MRRPKKMTIGYADTETEHILDLKARGIDVRIDGKVLRTDDGSIPTIGIKCAGLIIKRPNGKVTEHMYHTIPEFLDALAMNRVDRCYFHNLKFDDAFIASYMHNDTLQMDGYTVRSKCRLINDMGQVYSDTLEFDGIEGRKHGEPFTCELWDSAKIWASSLDSIGKSFGIIKGGTTGGSKALEVGCSKEMEEYCLQDCRVMMTAMEYYFERCREETGGKNPYGWMTAASTAYHLCMMHVRSELTTKEFEEVFPPYDAAHGAPSWSREGYKGAVPLLDPAIKNKPLKDVSVFDINSQYPDKLRNYPMPIGAPIRIREKTMDRLMELKEKGALWIAKVKLVMDVKEGHRATYLLKRKGGEDDETLAWHVDDLKGMFGDKESYQVITSADMDYILLDYDIRYVEVLDCVGFRADTNHVLAPFIDKWYAIKEKASAEDNKPLKAFAKLILNSLYGKFGANPEHISAEYVFDGDVIRVKECDGVDVDKTPLYLPVAMFTTAYARAVISQTCNAVGWDHVAYTDTDSLHIHGISPEEAMARIEKAGFKIHHTELGAYDYESRWGDVLYVRNKGYFHFNGLDIKTGEPNGDKEIKMAGANRFEGFESIEDVVNKELTGQQRRGYRVSGGILFMDMDVAIDTRMDAAIKSRRRVKGMNHAESMNEIARREEEIWEEWA